MAHSAQEHRAWIDMQLQHALRDWRRAGEPLYVQLAAALRRAIEAGELPAGRKLPPERILASYLDIGRRTVARAYEALSERALVDRRQGAGTRVTGPLVRPEDNRAAKRTTSLQRNIVFASFSHAAEPDVIDLLSVHTAGGTAIAAEALRTAADALQATARDHHGYAPAGYPPLREALATRYTARGLPTTPEQILVTSGAQQATTLVAADFAHPGETAIVEDPTTPGAIDVFRTAGANLLTVPPGDADAFEATVRRNVVGGAFLMPTFHSPTGLVMSEPARRRVAQLSAELQLGVAEDETAAELALDGDPPPPLAHYAHDAPIFSIGSLSTVFWAGLRVGWVRGPARTIAHLARLKAVSDLGTSIVAQAVAHRLLDDYDHVLAGRRAELRAKLDRVEAQLDTFDGWTWRRPPGGLCLWVRIPSGSALAFADVAREHGVAIMPGPIASSANRFDDHIRLPFAYDADVTEEALRRLAEAWHEFRSSWSGSARAPR